MPFILPPLCFTDQGTLIVSGSGIVILFLIYLRVSRQRPCQVKKKKVVHRMHPKESRLQHAAKGLNRSQAELMYMLMVKKKKAQADGKKGKKQNDRCIL